MKKLMCEPIEDKSKIAKAHSRGRVQLAKMVENVRTMTEDEIKKLGII